jgi:hypothetical protein
MRQGPLWIVKLPLSTGERIGVNDPIRSLTDPQSGQLKSQKQTK